MTKSRITRKEANELYEAKRTIAMLRDQVETDDNARQQDLAVMDRPRNVPEAAFWLASFFAIGWLLALATP